MATSSKTQSPDLANFINPFDHPDLADYLRNILRWHGYIRFVGLPSLRENPDVPIDRLYVEPRIGENPISPDVPPEHWQKTEKVIDALYQHRSLVILGDPGSGKSTLVSWVACQFARTDKTICVRKLNRLIPLPMILRDLSLKTAMTWNHLLQAFLNIEMAKTLRGNEILDRLLSSGQVIVILDGLDELASVGVRKALREAVFEGMDKYPACRWLLTSRIIGYDGVPFDEKEIYVRPPLNNFDFVWPAPRFFSMQHHVPRDFEFNQESYFHSVRVACKSYIAPFDNAQTARFARNWFALREIISERAETNAADLIRAVRAHPMTLRLSRTPTILTMMALIFRVRAKLPHGRALLYDQITEAYLQSIDEYRSLSEMEYPLLEKRRWLASVAFNMQMRRFEQAKKGNDHRSDQTNLVNTESDILVSESNVRSWIVEAMEVSGYGQDEKAAADFIEYIGRRSGLLLPRGPHQFAFMHLSIQEYFAACFLEELISSPLWIKSGHGPPGADSDSLTTYTNHVVWTETLVFLFELLAHRPGLPQFMAETLFGKDFENIKRYTLSHEPTVSLVATLAVDPHSGFTKKMRRKAIEGCCMWEVKTQQLVFEEWKKGEQKAHEPRVLQTLLATQDVDVEPQDILKYLVTAANGVKLEYLSLRGTSVTDPTPLAKSSCLKGLNLSDTFVTNLGFLTNLTDIQQFALNRTPVSDIRDLSCLANLQVLCLSECPVSTLGPIRDLNNLDTLDLSDTRVSDLCPLASLTNIRHLILSGTGISDISPVSNLVQLEILTVSRTALLDLRPLLNLTNLKAINISGTKISDLRLLAGLRNLEEIYLVETEVSKEEISSLQEIRRRLGLAEIRIER